MKKLTIRIPEQKDCTFEWFKAKKGVIINSKAFGNTVHNLAHIWGCEVEKLKRSAYHSHLVDHLFDLIGEKINNGEL